MTAHRFDITDPYPEAVLKPVLYTDIFDFPLTFEEIYQFLDCQASADQARLWLQQALEAGFLVCTGGYYSLPHRTELVATRQFRQQLAKKLWPQAVRYGLWMASLPFVEMVAVTGSLAVDNPRSSTEDIDFLIVTRPGRLWFCRALIILLVRLGRLRGTHLCPNYLISQNALEFEHGLYSARELLQMQPIYGQKTYAAIRQRNPWTGVYFPQSRNTDLPQAGQDLSRWQQAFKNASEFVFAGSIGDRLEEPLQHIQISKHRRQARERNSADTVVFNADICKGHYDSHGKVTLTRYQQRVGMIARYAATRNNGRC